MSAEISVLLTSFKRPQTLKPQLDAVRNQSIAPKRIVVWHNGSEVRPDLTTLKTVDHVYCSSNWGVWPRMDFCRNFDTEYVAVIDDDTIPGRKALEVCWEAHQETQGLVGGNGVRFTEGTRWPREYIGLDGHRDAPVRVDIIGHLWFFPRSWLDIFTLTRRFGNHRCGEDYHWSYSLQRQGNGCYVPRRDLADSGTWTSLQPQLGTDDVALYRQEGAEEEKEACHTKYLLAGWKTLYQMRQQSVELAKA